MPTVNYIDGDTETCDKIEIREGLFYLIRNNEVIRTSETGTILEIV